MRKSIPFFIIFIIALLLLSCGGKKTIQQKTPVVSAINQTTGGSSLNRASPPIQNDYILGPGDVLDIDVFQVEELKRTVRINSAGYIKFPPAGRIKISGLTLPKAEEEIGARLRHYINKPVVSIFIKEYMSQKVTILGAVKNPQVYVMDGQKYLLDIISAAGGLEKDAGDVCYIQRGRETTVINLYDLLYKGDMRLNIPVFAGDVIDVPMGGVIFVDGSVNGPGAFPVSGGITLTQAIAMAKGLKSVAEKDNIRIYRDSGKEIRDIIEVDYDEILANKIPDPHLKDKDIVVVPMNGVKDFFVKFFRTIRFFVRFGDVSTGVGY
ncbi:polysialic acid transport protein KpsD precursor [bacterium BMS3Abin07]|nr:polysialic acid transport protein KpsD precursor [bacterium BMS3Abin07]GBE33066.1 polysialic acid transport protein KpsD precursor [bacterium BMS3Bbin05]HDO21838.1 hypothetical protein [Nitrospirota bacterium]HDZ87399.1 hypothetical protein [Nitrospirota bacterium]